MFHEGSSQTAVAVWEASNLNILREIQTIEWNTELEKDLHARRITFNLDWIKDKKIDIK